MIWSFYISYNKFILTKKEKMEVLNNITQNKFHTNTQLIKENPSSLFFNCFFHFHKFLIYFCLD